MTKAIDAIEPDWYSLAEAAKILNAGIEGLIHGAANGKIQLCVLANKWMAERVYQYDHTIDIGDALSSAYSGTGLTTENMFLAMATNNDFPPALKPTFRGPTPPPIPDPEAKNYQEQLSLYLRTHDCQDMVMGHIVAYGKHGNSRALYDMSYDGLLPIAKKCFKEYLIRPDTAKVEIDLYQYFNMSNEALDAYMVPENEVLIKDVFNNGKLVVKSNEIRRLTTPIGSQDSKPEAGVSRNSLLKLIIGMAIKGYRFDPKAKRNMILQELMTDLEQAEVSLDAQTIRDALNEAITALPSAPHKS